MARKVPKAQTVHTTKYDNFRGVDYTNDSSNVWYRRSPDGLNMLPNLDGHPFKRKGWKVEHTPIDFYRAKYGEYDPASSYTVNTLVVHDGVLYKCTSNTTGTFDPSDWSEQNAVLEQYKVDYFELGGLEYLFFFTSLGCFYYTNTLTYIDKSWDLPSDDVTEENSSPFYYRPYVTYDVGDYVWNWDNGDKKYYRCNTQISTPETFTSAHWDTVVEVDGVLQIYNSFPPSGTSIDHNKAFFFEGGGRAGYYIFANERMFWFDGSILHESHPYFPLVLVGCDTNGAGTLLYDINLLTDWRIIQFQGDGTSTVFTIPDGFDDDIDGANAYPTGILAVYLLNAQGGWDVQDFALDTSADWTYAGNAGQIVMNTPPPSGDGEDVLRVVYRPSGYSATSSSTVNTGEGSLKVVRDRISMVEEKYTNGVWKETGTYLNGTNHKLTESPSFSITRPKRPLSDNIKVYVHKVNADGTYGSWVQDTTKLNMSYTAYGDTVDVSCNDAQTLWNSNYNLADPISMYVNLSYTYTTPTLRWRNQEYLEYKLYDVYVQYDSWDYAETNAVSRHRNAFYSSSKSLIFGNGIINQAFLTASNVDDFSTRVWYSSATDPSYFPDTNYMEVGATDKQIMGLIKVGDYLGVIKRGSATDTSIYLAYPTSFEEETTYAVKQSVNGIGAVSNGAFNILNDEPLFLSEEGVMAIEFTEDDSRTIRNRSYYINKKLKEEGSLKNAFSFVFNGMYLLGINNHCYVLDGSQKTSWENTKTNLQYECYYLENIPAKCFAKKDGRLWFVDNMGNACRFRDARDELLYVDAYSVDALNNPDITPIKASIAPTDLTYSFTDLIERKFTAEQLGITNTYDLYLVYGFEHTFTSPLPTEMSSVRFEFSNGESVLDSFEPPFSYNGTKVTVSKTDLESKPVGTTRVVVWFEYYYEVQADVNVGTVIQYGNTFYTVSEADEENQTAKVIEGFPIKAVWSTIADDDGSAHYYKNLQKKGSVVVMMPMSDSGVRVYLKPDEKEPIYVGETDIGSRTLPFNYYTKKKVKRYKRLKIICENDTYNDGFGIDEIIKSYTVGNYAKR